MPPRMSSPSGKAGVSGKGGRWSRHSDRSKDRRSGMAFFGDAVEDWLSVRMGDPRRAHLEQLWRNWEMVMGPNLAPLARPMGHREGLLLIGAEDHFVMQELTYSVPEILERVNAFMGEEFFRKVELRLMFEKTPLDQTTVTRIPSPPPPPRPERLGDLNLDPESPVGRCYAAYLRFFGKGT